MQVEHLQTFQSNIMYAVKVIQDAAFIKKKKQSTDF